MLRSGRRNAARRRWPRHRLDSRPSQPRPKPPVVRGFESIADPIIAPPGTSGTRTMSRVGQIATANEEAIRAWDGPLFDAFVRFRHVMTTGLGAHGEEALRLAPLLPDQQVLDIGCGFGDATQRLAGLVGPTGEVLGVDAAPRFIETASQ